MTKDVCFNIVSAPALLDDFERHERKLQVMKQIILNTLDDHQVPWSQRDQEIMEYVRAIYKQFAQEHNWISKD